MTDISPDPLAAVTDAPAPAPAPDPAPGEFVEPASVSAAAIGAVGDKPSLDDLKERLALYRLVAQTKSLSGNQTQSFDGFNALALLDAIDYLLGV